MYIEAKDDVSSPQLDGDNRAFYCMHQLRIPAFNIIKEIRDSRKKG
jgi:hypothetical protein